MKKWVGRWPKREELLRNGFRRDRVTYDRYRAQRVAVKLAVQAGGGMAVLEWLVRLLNLSFDMGVVPMDWRGACIVPLYKGKGDKCQATLEVLVC